MPVIKKQDAGSAGMVGIWEISESRQELERLLLSVDREQIASVPHPEKWKEKAAARILLRNLLDEAGIPANPILYDTYGKPFTKEINLSISHTAGYAAAIINTRTPVGIDIESYKPKLLAVSNRVMSATELDEIRNNPEKAVFYWCAKEVLYKIHGAGKLDLQRHLYIHPFQMTNDFDCIGEIRSDTASSSHTLRCMWINKLALVYNLL